MTLPEVDKKIIIMLSAVLVILLGVMIFAMKKSNIGLSKPQTQSLYEKEIEQITNQSASDNVDLIQSDLNNTELNNLDKELGLIENEINATY